jgi:ketosteroid isomerase-like protein
MKCGRSVGVLRGSAAEAEQDWWPMNPHASDFDVKSMADRLQVGISRMMDGDLAPFRSLLTAQDDVAILGAYGRCVVGQAAVSARFEQTAAGYAGGGGHSTHELVSSWVGTDLACIVTVEHHSTRLDPSADPVSFQYRATHLFRREPGGWKIVLRHADPLVTYVGPQIAHAIAQGTGGN